MAESEQIELFLSQLVDNVKAGKTPDEAARRLVLMAPAQARLIEEALRLYRRRASEVRTLRIPPSVQDENYEPWYVGPEEGDVFWSALKKHLSRKGWDEGALASLDGSSTKALSLMPPPGGGVVSSRGLVVGYVQSGKTANFTAVISKAADVGYRLFIVLSGLTDSLRNQTQDRLDKEVIQLNPERWYQLTTYGEDFKQHGNVNAFLTDKSPLNRILAVVKKNSSRLRRLKEWLGGARAEVLNSCPILIIDDEADQASVNSASDPERRTRINSLLVELLGLIPKVAYVGYTATPFANVFIDPNSPVDLYPRDFIMYLPKPSGYFGPEQIFGRDPVDWDEADAGADGLDMIRKIDDKEIELLKPAVDGSARPSIVPSLGNALRYFWMATAARQVRGQADEHATMLLHTSQSIAVHNSFEEPLETYRRELLESWDSTDPDLLEDLEELWQAETRRVSATELGCAPVSFAELKSELRDVLNRTRVIIENSKSQQRIDYLTPGRRYVVVGGNVLARGLTLEGLTVSYFLRTASAYDTLLQMGRWFGFRPGYEDLPRVWMTGELQGYFYDLATVEKEIRADIDRYKDGAVSPLEFGVRVRTHPQLAITSKLKMQHAVHANMSFAGRSAQTTVFRHTDQAWLRGNIKAAKDLITRLREDGLYGKPMQSRPHSVFEKVKSERVLEFLDSYSIHPEMDQMRADLLKKYITLENDKGRLRYWNVAVATRAANDLGSIDLGLEGDVHLINRAGFQRDRGSRDVADIKGLMSGIDDGLDLDLPRSELESLGREDLRKRRDQDIPDRGLLILYPIAKDSMPKEGQNKRKPLNAVEHVIGLALVFPAPDEAPKVDYMTVDLSRVPREETDYDDEERVA